MRIFTWGQLLLLSLLIGCGGSGSGASSSTGNPGSPGGVGNAGNLGNSGNTGNTGNTPAVKKVLILGLDGCRPDALAVAATPVFDQLIASGVYSDQARATDTTWSGSGWSTLLHGVWRDKHGVRDNSFSGSSYAVWPDVFTRIEGVTPALNTVRITSWGGMQTHMVSGADQVLQTGDDIQTLALATSWLDGSAGDADVLFVYFGEPDLSGHAHGFHPSVPQYIQAIEQVDSQVGALLQTLQARSSYANEDWLVLASTDHGGTISGHGVDRPEDRTVFLLASGPAVLQPGSRILPDPAQVDLVPTLLAHLGIPAAPSWQLDGMVVGLAATAPAVPVGYNSNLLANGGAELERGFADVANDLWPRQWQDVGAATAIMYGSAGFPDAADPGPASRGASFFAGGAEGVSSLVQRVDVSTLAAAIDAPSGVDFSLTGWLGGYADQDDRARLNLRFYGATPERAALRLPGDKLGFFEAATWTQYDAVSDAADPGYPRSIATDWPGLGSFAGGAQDIDAAMAGSSAKLYFFKADAYIRFDTGLGQADPGYPRSIASYWPGLDRFAGGARDLDAAVDWGNGKLYFFKGAEYIRYDKAADSADAGYPRSISHSTWDGLAVWPSGFDAALRWPTDSDRAYLFKPGAYIRYAIGADRVYDGSYPRSVDATSWNGLNSWYQSSAELISLEGPSAADRGNQTGLFFRTVAGSLPSGTRMLELELQFRRADGTSNDGYADELSLELQP